MAVPEAMYESDAAVSQYCEAHFGKTYYNVPNFMAQCAAVASSMRRAARGGRRLDLGCAVGRAVFELAREFEFVTGIDFSARFIRIAHAAQGEGHYLLRPRRGRRDRFLPRGTARRRWAWRKWPAAWSSCKATPRISSRNSAATT